MPRGFSRALTFAWLAFVLAAGCAARAGEYPALAAGREGRGRLEFVQGVPVLHLAGSPAEMGRQQGVLLGRQFVALRREYLEKFIGSDAGRNALVLAGVGMVQHMPEAYVAEVRALAEASGARFADAVLANTFLDTARAAMCSVAIACGEATGGEPLLFARNLDFPSLGIAEKASLVVVYHPEPGRGRPFIAVGWPGLVGVISGMNDAGLCVATLVSFSARGAEPGTPYPMMYRQVLERCATPQEALEVVKATRRTCANNLAVAGPRGEPLVIEFTPTKVAARTPTRGVLLATNHFRSPEHVKEPDPLDGRYATLERLAAAAHGRLDVAALTKMLQAVAQGMTLQAMVFEPAARRLHLSIGRVPASDGPFVTIDCGRLFEAK